MLLVYLSRGMPLPSFKYPPHTRLLIDLLDLPEYSIACFRRMSSQISRFYTDRRTKLLSPWDYLPLKLQCLIDQYVWDNWFLVITMVDIYICLI